jgi:hypothetical protein
MSNKLWKTQIKRGHLVYSSGVGSVIRTQNGVTAVIAGLTEWIKSLPVSGSDIQALRKAQLEYLKNYEIRDAELEAACGVSRFIAPPKQEEEGFSGKKNHDWEIPMIRFPLVGVCENYQCQRVRRAHESDSKILDCLICNSDKKFKYKTRQVPIFLACRNGHLDEINWDTLVKHTHDCPQSEIKIDIGEVLTSPKATCVKCNVKSDKEEMDFPCTGRFPWIPHLPHEACEEKMRIIERTSVTSYYASTKSSIHIPVDSKYNERVLDWLVTHNFVALVNVSDSDAIAALKRMVDEAGFELSTTSLIEHVSYLKSRQSKKSEGNEFWDVGAARARELDILTGKNDYPALRNSKLIEFDVLDIGKYQHELIGNDRLISGISAVHRLTETRVLDGFSRIEPKQLSSRDGYKLLWGHEIPSESWLPGYRVHGEGILIELNGDLVRERLSPGTVDPKLIDLGNSRSPLSPGGVLAHSLAHLLITALADDCGYQLPSIRDRIYDLVDGRLGLLVYTAEGDTVGTLGGLVAFAEAGKFEKLLDQALEIARWCPQDPVCIERVPDIHAGIHAACHQCLLLPETCCEKFNSWLDRSTIVGGSVKYPAGILSDR